jgi:hydrogenase-4 component E
MSPLLSALVGVMLIPLFVATWRTSLGCLSCQGFLMAWIALRMGLSPSSIHDWLTLVDLILVRGVAAPLALYGVLRSQNAPARNDVIPPNLLSWTLALGMVLAAFNFSELLVVQHGQQQSLIAVSTAGLLLGFLVLATRSDTFSQILGVLRIENAIALFELGGQREHRAIGVQLGQIAVFVLTVWLYRWHLKTLSASAVVAHEVAPEGPTL